MLDVLAFQHKEHANVKKQKTIVHRNFKSSVDLHHTALGQCTADTNYLIIIRMTGASWYISNEQFDDVKTVASKYAKAYEKRLQKKGCIDIQTRRSSNSWKSRQNTQLI